MSIRFFAAIHRDLKDCVNTIDAIYRNYYRVEESLLALGEIAHPNLNQ